MIKVTLKDGSVKEIEQAMSVIDFAKSISEGLARVATCAEIDGEVKDLRFMIEKDCTLNILTFDSDLNGKKYIKPLVIKEDTVIYKKIATYFVGEEKKDKINLDYPIYINDNAWLLNLTDSNKLITTDFEEIDGYNNSTLSDGVLYNNLQDFYS